MKYIEVKKRGWVKNAAIAFLAVMLVLTFFSNTIMNRSLPEVAAQYATSGSITARIRGSGTVTANENFEVKTNLTRTIGEVPVKVGDEVKFGDILLTLTGTSEDLENAQEALTNAEITLEKALINSPLVGNAVANAALGVQSARNSLAEAQRVLSGVSYSEAAYNAALNANNQAQAAVNQAQATANSAAAVTSARQYDLSVAIAELTALEDAEELGETIPQEDMDAAIQKRNDAQLAFSLASAASIAASDALSAASSAAAAPAAEFAKQSDNRQMWLSASAGVRAAQEGLNAANATLTQAQLSDNAATGINSVEIREYRRNIEELREKVTELQREGRSMEITAVVAGVITSISQGVTPGSQATADEILMVIEVVDRGYTLTFSVSTQQASRVTVGDSAEVDRGWWGGGREPILATLVGIRNDPMNPATQRILHFAVSGEDVEGGMQLNVTMSQRTENYNVIVPNNAIRSDTNGDFVLVVMSRSSPLGNRYIATRVDVTVLAADDTHTAVTGGLQGWDFVITTSSAPIDPGMQIRLVDNP